MSQKRVSATAWGLLECAARYLNENFLGARRPAKARERGIAFHMAVEGVNRLRMKEVDVGPEECRKIVDALAIKDPMTAADILAATVWWAERMQGIVPIGVEDDGGRWTMTMGGIEWVGKFDLIYRNTETGRITVCDFKSGFIPEKDEAKRTIQNIIYAKAAMGIYDAVQADVLMVSLSNRFSFLLEYDAPWIDSVWSFMEKDGATIHAQHQRIEAAVQQGESAVAGLLAEPEFAPAMNPWCHSCPVKQHCREYGQLVWRPDWSWEGAPSRPDAVKALRNRRKIVEQALEDHERDLKADAAEEGGITEGGYHVKLVTKTFTVKARPATEQTQTRMVIERVGEE